MIMLLLLVDFHELSAMTFFTELPQRKICNTGMRKIQETGHEPNQPKVPLFYGKQPI